MSTPSLRGRFEGTSARRGVELLGMIAILVFFLSLPVFLQQQSLADFYGSLFEVTFGTPSGWISTLVKAIPVFIAGMGVLLAFRTGFWNIGAEGQMAIGAFAAAGVAFSGSALPAVVLIPAAMLVGTVAGGLYGGIAGWLKLRYDVNEILTTLMLNFVGLLFVDYGAKSLWGSSLGFPFSKKVPSNLMLPTLFGTELHVGIVVAIALFPLVGFLLYRTPFGFEFRTVGADAEAARNSGIPIARSTLLIVLLSGALAGLAGSIELLGVVGRLQSGITGPNYGYIAIVATLLTGHRLRYLPLSALFLGGLLAANVALQTSVSGGAELFIIGLVLLGVLVVNRTA
ncbi:MAG: ABC transporter permease [Salinigranum sp.]